MATTTSSSYQTESDEDTQTEDRGWSPTVSAASDTTNRTDKTEKHKVQPIQVSGSLSVTRELFSSLGSTAVAYTDDMQVLAVGQENGSVQLYQDGAAKHLMYDYEMSLENEPCTDIKVKVSPKGGFHKTVLAAYLSGHIKLWDTTIGKCLFTMRENRHLHGVNYHPRSNRFVTSGHDFKVNVYDEETRIMERVFSRSAFGSTNGHTLSVSCAQFHPKNSFELISAGLDNTIQFWDLRAPYAVRNIYGACPYGDGLDLSYDGKTILSCCSNNPNCQIRLFDYDTGKLMRELNFPTSYAYSVKFLTQNIAGICTFYKHSFLIVHLETKEIIGSVTNLPGPAISFSACKKLPPYRLIHSAVPNVVVSCGEKILELQSLLEETFQDQDPN